MRNIKFKLVMGGLLLIGIAINYIACDKGEIIPEDLELKGNFFNSTDVTLATSGAEFINIKVAKGRPVIEGDTCDCWIVVDGANKLSSSEEYQINAPNNPLYYGYCYGDEVGFKDMNGKTYMYFLNDVNQFQQ